MNRARRLEVFTERLKAARHDALVAKHVATLAADRFVQAFDRKGVTSKRLAVLANECRLATGRLTSALFLVDRFTTEVKTARAGKRRPGGRTTWPDTWQIALRAEPKRIREGERLARIEESPDSRRFRRSP